MKKARWKQTGENGAVMLFMIVVVAIMATYITSLLPKMEHPYPKKKFKAIDELQEIAASGRDYYFDKKAFPTSGVNWTASITDYVNQGVIAGDSSYGDGLFDEFRGAGWYNWLTEELYTDGRYATTTLTFDLYDSSRDVWSLGGDETDDAGGDDDIYRYAVNYLAAEARTRRLLDIIRARYTKYKIDNAAWNLTGTWTTDKGTLGLGAEFILDGWGQTFLCGPAGAKVTKTYVYSKGYNKIDNSNASDDIGW